SCVHDITYASVVLRLLSRPLSLSLFPYTTLFRSKCTSLPFRFNCKTTFCSGFLTFTHCCNDTKGGRYDETIKAIYVDKTTTKKYTNDECRTIVNRRMFYS